MIILNQQREFESRVLEHPKIWVELGWGDEHKKPAIYVSLK